MGNSNNNEQTLNSNCNQDALNSNKAILDGDAEAHLIAIACSEAPQGYQRWTLQLLADRMVRLGHVDSLSYETVRRTLKKTNLSLG